MYLKYGDYSHDINEAVVEIDQEPMWNDRGERYALRVTYRIRGMLFGDTVAEVTTAIAALEEAYAEDFLDIGLYEDGGTPTAHVLASADTLKGNRIIKGPSYPDGTKAEYTTFRSYEIVVEGEVGSEDDVNNMEFHQRLELTGGGHRFVYIETRNGPPQKQLVSEQTTYQAVQSGNAVGQFSYPAVPSPLWPDAEHRPQRMVSTEAPKREGEELREYGISWRYVFESATPLVGLPGIPPQ